MRKQIIFGLVMSALGASWATDAGAQLDSIEARQDSLVNNMESTLIGKDDSPVAASGYMAFRVKNFHHTEHASFQDNDKARTSVDALLQTSLVVTPNPFMTLWTNMAFPYDLSGVYANGLASSANTAPINHSERVLFDHNTDYVGSTVNEEMNVGVDMRAGGVGAFLTAGGVIWANASPLTMWEREANPRFASQYELFEDEKTVSLYYKEKAFKPVKEGGRAFWTNRSFGGLFLNAYQLPGNFTAQAMLSQPKDMDAGTRDGLRMYGGQTGELEMLGDYDFRGDVYHGRLAKQKLFGNMAIGANYMGVFFDNGIVYEPEFQQNFKNGVEPYFLNSQVASLDVRGNLDPKFYIMADVAFSWADSVTFKDLDTSSVNSFEKSYTEEASSSPEVGVYVKMQDKHLDNLPTTVELLYLPKDFFSPYGMSDPSRLRSWRKDEMYLNAGALRYGSNLAGINVKLEPEFNRGRLGFQYGLHRQVEEGLDVLVFNYRLNGRNMWESSNSWTKHNALFTSDSGNATGRYVNRAGVLSDGGKMNRQQGGLRGGTWELWESFAAYDNVSQLRDQQVPTSTKWSSFLSLEGGYDIGHWFGTERNVMMQGYASISGLSRTVAPIAYSESQTDMLLWSFYGMFEPALAVTPTFHVLGTFGVETWRAENAYLYKNIASGADSKSEYFDLLSDGGNLYVKAPINYLQTALGAGFDWDFADRAGLHVRYKWATHSDETVSANDWKAHYIQAETKVWF